MAYVHQRFKLVDLPKAAAKAIEEGKISAAVGLLIARIPDVKLREKATKEITHSDNWRGPMDYKSAKDFIQREFMTELSNAPFNIEDPTLVLAAGSCLECPKRTGSQANLFSDVVKDSCTDNVCFAEKKKVHFARILQKAKENGLEILTGREADAAESYNSKYIKP